MPIEAALGSEKRSGAIVARYLYTLRYLRPVQIYGRIWFRLHAVRPDVHVKVSLRPPSGRWVPPIERTASMTDANTFRFLNCLGNIVSASDWNDPRRDKLWLYNLHYFDDLNAVGAAGRAAWHRALIDRWVRDNSPGAGNGWEPYPTSLRIVNWIKWCLAGNALEPQWMHSLGTQVRWLRQRIEWHLLGNHLFANAKALVFAGLFFKGDEGAEWLAKGLKILRKQVPEQVLADGGHFELSPMYHGIVLEDLLDLVNATGTWPGQVPQTVLIQWRETASRMLRWAKGLSHPDGEIAFFNDAALGVAPNFAMLEAYAKRLEIEAPAHANDPVTYFEDSGYVRLARGGAVALLDVAPVGPDYLPGHAHADTLSFELSLFGQRVLVNSGTSCYGGSPERLRQRSTSVHNTVVVNGQDSSEVWGSFRVARRARPLGLQLNGVGEVLRAKCAHSGYRRLKGKPIHWREWALHESQLTVRDWIEGPFEDAEAFFHFHPAVTMEPSKGAQAGSVILPNGHRVSWESVEGIAAVRPTTYHPRFGVSESSNSLRIRFAGSESRVIFRW